MSKLKKYNEFLNEADETVAAPAQPATASAQTTEINVEIINKLFTDLKSIVAKKIEENKKLITDYYNKTTKDGQEINTTDEFYTYGIYNGNEKVNNKKMTFKIKFNEPTDSGLTYNVIGSVDVPELKNIEAKEIEIVKKSAAGSVKLNPGFINGKYVVKDKEKINLLKPKEENPIQPTQTSRSTETSGTTETSGKTKDGVGFKKDEEYFKFVRKPDKTKTFLIQRVKITDVLPENKISFNVLSNNEVGVFDAPTPKTETIGKNIFFKDVNKLLDSYKQFISNKNLNDDVIVGILNDPNKKPSKKLDVNSYYNYKNDKGKIITVQIINYDKKNRHYIAKAGTAEFPLDGDKIKRVGKKVNEPKKEQSKEGRKFNPNKIYDFKGKKAKITGPSESGTYMVSLDGGVPQPWKKEDMAQIGDELK
jgi:hypothetical protein